MNRDSLKDQAAANILSYQSNVNSKKAAQKFNENL